MKVCSALCIVSKVYVMLYINLYELGVIPFQNANYNNFEEIARSILGNTPVETYAQSIFYFIIINI